MFPVLLFPNFISSSHLYHNQIRHDTDDTLDVSMFSDFFSCILLEMKRRKPIVWCVKGLWAERKEMLKVLI